MTLHWRVEERRPKTLAMVADGCTNRVIAKRLGITLSAATRDLTALMHQYGARDRAHLVALAFRAGDLT